jgi:hypothetical protein
MAFVNRNPPIDGRACGFIRVHLRKTAKTLADT